MLINFIDLFEKSAFGLIFTIAFSFYLVDLCSNFCSFFSSPYFGSDLSFFPSFLRWKLTLLILDLSSSLIYAFSVINFPLSSALIASHGFWYVVFSLLFSSKYFKISFEISALTHVLLRRVLFNLQLFWGFSSYLSLIDF